MSAECCKFMWMSSLAKYNPVKINDVPAVLYCWNTAEIPPPRCVLGIECLRQLCVKQSRNMLQSAKKSPDRGLGFVCYCSRWTDRQAQVSSLISLWCPWVTGRAGSEREQLGSVWPGRWCTCGSVRRSCIVLALLHIPQSCVFECVRVRALPLKTAYEAVDAQ